MTAVASSHLPTYYRSSNSEKQSEYVNEKLRQPLAQPSREPVNNSTLPHASLIQENGRGKRPNESTAGLPESSKLALSRLEQPDPPAQAPGLETLDKHDSLVPRPTGQLVRANTDLGPRSQSPLPGREGAEDNWELRHGWEDQYNSSEFLGLLTSVSLRNSHTR